MHIEIRWSLLNAKRQVVKYGASQALFIDAESFPGEIVFGWAITRDMCSEAGSLSFSVCFYIGENKAAEEIGLRDYSLNTQIASLPVKAGIGIANVKEQVDSQNDIFKALFNSVYTDKSVMPLDQPVFSYLSWEHDNIPNEYVYPFESTLAQYKIANLGNETQWDAPVELYASAYCPGATAMSYEGSFIAENAKETDNPVTLEIAPKYIVMDETLAKEDLEINAIYGDTGAVYVKKNGESWNETPMSLTEIKEYFAQINQIINSNPPVEFEYGSVAKKYMAINADKVGIYRFSASGSKTVEVDGKQITVNSKKGQSSAVIIPPACKPIANGLVINVEGEIDPSQVDIIDKNNTDYIYVSAGVGKITSVRSDGLGILVGTHEIGTDKPNEQSIVDGKKPVDDYNVFAGEFALVINDGMSDEDLGEENLFVKIKNNIATDEDFAQLTFKSMPYINDKEFSGEYGIIFENDGIPVEANGIKIEGYAVHRKNGTYRVSELLSADKIATPAAYSLSATNGEGASNLTVEFALQEQSGFSAYKSIYASDNPPVGFGGKIYNTDPAKKNQSIKLKASYAGDTNGAGFKLHWYYGATPAEATSMKKEYVNGGNGGLIKIEQVDKDSILTIDGAIDTGIVTYLMLTGENEFNNTVSKVSFENIIIAIGESGI